MHRQPASVGHHGGDVAEAEAHPAVACLGFLRARTLVHLDDPVAAAHGAGRIRRLLEGARGGQLIGGGRLRGEVLARLGEGTGLELGLGAPTCDVGAEQGQARLEIVEGGDGVGKPVEREERAAAGVADVGAIVIGGTERAHERERVAPALGADGLGHRAHRRGRRGVGADRERAGIDGARFSRPGGTDGGGVRSAGDGSGGGYGDHHGRQRSGQRALTRGHGTLRRPTSRRSG